ncbi:MAG: hypothetical protein M9887_11635 [Chitinophagales bacterium]|nr:hypothetical protein [Chitinophagales bacterium]
MDKHKKIYLLLLGIFMLFVQKSAATENDTLVIDQNFVEQRIGQFIKISTEKKEDVLSILETFSSDSTSWHRNRSREIILNRRAKMYWLSTYIHNEDDKSRTLFLGMANPSLKQFSVFQGDGNHWQKIAEMDEGKMIEKKLRPHRNYIIPITMSAHETIHLLIKIDKQWLPAIFPLTLVNEYSLVRRTNNDNLFLGVYLGIHLLFILTLFALYYVTKNTFFTLYMSISLLFLLYNLIDTGIGLQYIWSSVPALQNVLPNFIVLFVILLHITFIRKFFNTSLHLAVFNKFLQVLFWLVVTFSFFFLITTIFNRSNLLPYFELYQIVNGLYLGYGIIVLILCIMMLFRVKRKEIIWVTGVVLLQLLTWAVHILSRGNVFTLKINNWSFFDLNLFESSLSVPHISFLLILLEIFIVTSLLSVSFYEFIKDNSSGKYKLMLLRRNTINAYIDGQERERIELKGKIHDEIQQDIQMLEKQINAAIKEYEDPIIKSKLLNLSEEINSIDKQLDTINSGLILNEFVDKDLNTIIKEAFRHLEINKILVRFNLSDSNLNIKELAKMNIYRMLQEIVKNISKHSQAKNVSVSSYYTKANLYIKVEDDGIGFDTDNNKSGIGLLNIQSRTKGLDGELIITSLPNKGTLLKMIIPIEELIR